MNNFGLPERTVNEILEFFKSVPDVERVVIFGSRVKNTYKIGSDIDFAVWTDNHNDFYRIAAGLDDLPTPYKFDVIDYKTLSHEAMKKSIDDDGVLFYEK